jgi:glutamine synthetase
MVGSLGLSENHEVARFVSEKGIRIVNLCHVPEDGRLKTVSFSAADEGRLLELLDFGERVDGSSLFSFIEPGQSDIYIKPICTKAFVSPFAAVPTLNVLCDYLDQDGKPLNVAPVSVLRRAEDRLRGSAGLELRALAELEFYVMSRLENEALFPASPDRNYHESAPFARFENVRNEVLLTLADAGVGTKYGHAEVGRILTRDNVLAEQHEVEFTAKSMDEMADTVAIAKWIVRNVCSNHGLSASFSPKIALQHAGTGMHVHLCGVRDEVNVLVDERGALSDYALKMIGGILRFASSLAAFGNTTPVSYLRFIARKESPMHICWGSRNRLALIRIPLWWAHRRKDSARGTCRETFEYRAPDAFANAYLLFAALTVAVDYGLENPKESLRIAEDLHVDAGSSGHESLGTLPHSCCEAADSLEQDRCFYEAGGVFPERLVDKTIEKLRSYDDRDLWKGSAGKSRKVDDLLKKYLHYG